MLIEFELRLFCKQWHSLAVGIRHRQLNVDRVFAGLHILVWAILIHAVFPSKYTRVVPLRFVLAG